MTFLHTSLLAAGLACIAIPIIIHLLMNRRRKPVMWGAMRFLEEAFRRTRRRLLLEKWLLLAARCLLIALLAMAIARPLIGSLGAGGNAGRTFFVIVDNSLAAQVADEAGVTALDRHKAAARDALGALRTSGGEGGGDRVALITLGGPAEGLVLPASHDAAAVAAVVDGIEPTDARADFAGAMALISSALRPETGETTDGTPARTDRAFVIVLSDFLEGSADLGPDGGGAAATGAALAGVRLPEGVVLLATEPSEQSLGNVSIVAVEPLRSVVLGSGNAAADGAGGGGAGEQVRVTLRRSGTGLDAPQVTTVRARLAAPDAAESAAGESRVAVRWPPGQDTITTAVALPLTGTRSAARPDAPEDESPQSLTGGAVITVSIDRDPLAGDNTWRRPVEVRDALRVGIVAPTRFGRAGGVDRLDAAAWIRIALSPRSESARSASADIEVVNIEPASLDAARLAGLDAVFLPRPDLLAEGAWSRVRLFIENGGLVVVMPPAGVNVHLWGDALTGSLQPGWTTARQATTFGSPGAAGSRLGVAAATGAGGAGGHASAGTGGGSRLLSLIEGEREELLRPVGVWRALPMEGLANAQGETLLTLPDGSPALWTGPIGVGEEPTTEGAPRESDCGSRGLLAYVAVALDLEWSDLPTKPLMVPLLNELTLQGVGRARGATWTVAGSRPNVGRRVTELSHVPDAERTTAEIVQIDAEGVAREAIRRAGLWRSRDDRGGRRAVLAVNPDPGAGRTGAQPRETVQAWLASAVEAGDTTAPTAAGSAIIWLPRPVAAGSAAGGDARSVGAALQAALGAGRPDSPISLPLLIAVLSLALIELLLGRWASHASVVSGAASARTPALAAAGGAA